jgi:rubrerythrin
MGEKPVGTSMGVVRILEICRDIESYNAELYRYYGEIFSDNPEIAVLWKMTAMEEENHANQFVMAINLRKQGVVDSVNIDLYTAESTLEKVKSIYDGVRKTRPHILDAFRSAVALEEKLESFHMETVALFQDGTFKNLFTAMMKADKGHIAKLEAAYQKLLRS